MRPRRKSYNQNARTRIAKPRNRTRPVRLLLISLSFRLTYAAAVLAQTGASFAGDDGFFNPGKDCLRKLFVEGIHCI